MSKDKTEKRAARRTASKAENEAIKKTDAKKAAGKQKVGKAHPPASVPGDAPVGKAVEKARALLAQGLNEKFDAIHKTLSDTNKGGGKQPRALVQALEALDAARNAAARHIQHNV